MGAIQWLEYCSTNTSSKKMVLWDVFTESTVYAIVGQKQDKTISAMMLPLDKFETQAFGACRCPESSDIVTNCGLIMLEVRNNCVSM